MKYISSKDSLSSYQTGRKEGDGTESAPFFGDLDVIMRSLPASETIQLLPGTFYIRGVENQTDYEKRSYECFAPGQRIGGAGRSLTTIVLNSHPADSAVMLYSSYDGIEVRDLTIDVASVGNEKWKRDGLVLAGSDTVVERIGVKHVYGNASTDNEAWGIMVGNPTPNASVTSSRQRNNRVENCVIEEFLGDYVNGIDSGYGSRGILRGNEVILPDISIAEDGSFRKGHFAGLNLSMHSDLRVENNTIIDGRDAFYGERLLEGAIFRGNTIRGCWHGVRFPRFEAMRDCRFEENLIVCNGTTGGAVGFALHATNPQAPFENLEFSRNTLRGAMGKPCFPLVLEGSPIRHVRFRDNTMNPGHVFKGCASVYFDGNHCTDGTPIPAPIPAPS